MGMVKAFSSLETLASDLLWKPMRAFEESVGARRD